MMEEQTLEIRGIHRKDILIYVQEIKTKILPQKAEDAWKCTVSKEEIFHLFQSEIPKVFVTFSADTATLLEKIIKEFRLKTFRAGG